MNVNDMFDKVGGVFESAQQSVATKSAMNPLLWTTTSYFFFITIVLGLAWSFGIHDFDVPLIWSFLALLGVNVFVYLWLLFRDPDRLQSETFLIQRQRNQLIGQSIKAIPAEIVLPSLPASQSEPGANNYIDMLGSAEANDAR